MGRKGCGSVVLTLVVLMVSVGADDPSDTASDPLSGLFVRQEATLRKLDGLIAKVGKVDALEAKLDHITSLLQGLEDRNALLEARLADVEARHGVEVVDLKEAVKAQLVQAESRMEAKMEEVVEALDERLDQMEVLEARINAGRENDSECAPVEACDGELGETVRVLLEAHHLNLSQAGETALMDLREHLLEVVEAAVNGSERCNGWTEAIGKLEAAVAPAANATQRMVAAVINRIRVSNLAMDKRLEALLHTSSLRQRVLRDSLLAAVDALGGQVQAQSQAVYRKIEARVGGLEATLSAAVKLHTKGLAGQVLETANLTLATLAARLSLTLDHLHNTSTDLHLTLANLSAQPPAPPTLCLLHDPQPQQPQPQPQQQHPQPQPQKDQNTTTTTTTNSTSINTTTTVSTSSSNGTEFYQYSDAPTSYSLDTTHSRLLEETMKSLQEVVEARLSEVEDRLAGLRIYLSTSLHMHAEQVEERMSSVESGVQESVRQMLAKSSRTMDKLRRSSLGYLDAAVTSISSAAVTSAQSTADQLKDVLRDVTESLNERLDQVEASVRAASQVCPPPYQPVGGGCVVVLPGPPAPWEEGRERCRQAGGDLTTLPLPSLPLLTLALPPVPSTYWIGGRLVDAEWRWVTGDVLSGEVSGEDGDCLTVSVGTGGKPVPFPCHNLLPIICQHHQPLHSPRHNCPTFTSTPTLMKSTRHLYRLLPMICFICLRMSLMLYSILM